MGLKQIGLNGRTIIWDSMLKYWAKKCNLILRKGQNVRILSVLAVNHLFLLRLKLHKLLHGIKKPIVHYYAVCWNEEKMLPFMFDYYERFVEHFTIYDNYSDDHSEEIIRSHKCTDVIKFASMGFNDIVNQQIKNNCWKQSRGKADYVIVCDIDEFFYYPDINGLLERMYQNKVTTACLNGFDMYSEKALQYDSKRLITEMIRTGVASKKYSKTILFDPNSIVEINYEPGCHFCHPVGRVKPAQDTEIKMLHYKNIGIDVVLDRTAILAQRLSEVNKKAGFGVEYLRDAEVIKNEFYENLKASTKVI